MVNNKNGATKAKKVKRNGKPKNNGTATSSQPLATATQLRTSKPQLSNLANGCRISHREFIADIVGQTAFTVVAYAVNPGIAATFPWLSTQAMSWEQYRFTKLKFHYYTRAPATLSGSAMLAPDYDAADPDPTDEATATAYVDSIECAVWKDFTCILNPSAMASMGPKKFNRDSPIGTTDIKTYDVANLFVCTSGVNPSVGIGKLWVEYTIEFFTPQLKSVTLPVSSRVYYSVDSSYDTIPDSTPTTLTQPAALLNGIKAIASGVTGLKFPKGVYQLLVSADMETNAAEKWEGYIQILNNGLQIAGAIASFQNDTANANRAQTLVADAIVSLIGSEILTFVVYLVGATGTMKSRIRSFQATLL